MNLEKKLVEISKCLPLKWGPTALTFCGRVKDSTRTNRLLHRKSLPPLAKERVGEEGKKLEEVKSLAGPIQPAKLQRDIFGATILPQNLSFENAKRLSDNQIRLEDIPLVDENEAAEVLAAEKMRAKREKIPGVRRGEEEKEMTVARVGEEDRRDPGGDRKNSKSIAELFWIADPYEDIPGPKIFRRFFSGFKQIMRQLTIVSLFRFLKANAFAPFKAYGPVVKVPEILGGKIVLISRPEHISAVFEQDRRSPNNSVLDSIVRSRSQRRGKIRPLDSRPGQEWETAKRSLSERLVQNAEKYFDGIDEAAEKFVRRIKTIRNGQNEVPEDFLFEINKWSLECLCFLIFERSFGFLDYESAGSPSKKSQLLYSITLATKNFCHLESGFQFWRFVNTGSLSSLGSACDVLESIISERVAQVQSNLIRRKDDLSRGSSGNASVVESLLLQEDVTPEDVVSTVLDTFLIGMNAMSTSLGFLFYHLSMNPRVQAEVWKEVKEILPEKYSRLEYEHLCSFKYVRACLKESIRLKMPVPVMTRLLSRNVTISNYQIPKGTFVLMAAQVECMKEENFEDPLEFLPERWLERESAGLRHHRARHPFAFLPVGHYFDDGLQRRLAEISVWMCASMVSRHFTIDYLYGEIEATNTIISFPNKPFKFTFADRTT